MNECEAMTLLATALNDLGVKPGPIRTIWLTQDGFVVGQRFERGPIRAVWLFNENQMKFYDQDHKLLKVIALTANMSKAA